MSKNDYIVEIVSTMVRLGIEDNDNFVEYMTMILPQMNTLELKYELEQLVDLENSTKVDISDMPENYGLGCSWN